MILPVIWFAHVSGSVFFECTSCQVLCEMVGCVFTSGDMFSSHSSFLNLLCDEHICLTDICCVLLWLPASCAMWIADLLSICINVDF
jgi:hypothetical protein